MESQLGVQGRTKRTRRRTSSPGLECGPASQGLETCLSCSLSGAFFTGSHIRDCIVAVHASGGCLFMVTSALGAHMKFWPKAVCSSLHETDIVFGGQGPLEELITKAEEVFDPKIILVATGCVADIMADNVKDITAETQKRLKKAKAISVSSGGFLGDTFVGYEKALLSIIDQLVVPSWETSAQAKTGEPSVNVLGMIPGFDLFWEDNIKELKRIFGLLGIKVLNVLTGDCSLETLYALPSAHLNVVISDSTGVEAAKHLEESLAMPYVVAEGGAPIGVDPTVDLFRQVAKFFGIENRAEEIFEQEKRWVYQAICRGKDVHLLHTYGGLEFAVVADSGVALGMTRFLKDEMGLIPTYVGIANRNPQAPQSFARFMGEEMANIVEVEADGYHVREALLRTKPRIVFGRHDDKSTCREIGSTYIGISFPLYDRIPIAERPLMGFAGAVNIFDEMINLYAREQI